jgi:hypothetical protein
LPYATPADVYALIGESDALRLWAAGTLSAGDALAAGVTRAILLADAYLNETFQRSGYVVPVDPGDPDHNELDAQRGVRLAHASAVLAIVQYGAAGAVDTLPLIKKLGEDIASWLAAVLEGRENLLGIDRQPAEAAKLVTGRLAFAGSGERMSRRPFRQWGSLYGGGFNWNDRDERRAM